MKRFALPSRRDSSTFNFDHDGVTYTATVSHFSDGGVAELFLNAGKLGSPADKIAHDAAVIYSIARQHGVPDEMLRDAMAKLRDGSPAGPVGKALQIAEAA